MIIMMSRFFEEVENWAVCLQMRTEGQYFGVYFISSSAVLEFLV